MADSNIFVAYVRNVTAPPPRPLATDFIETHATGAVHFDNGRRATLESSPHAADYHRLLWYLKQAGHPAYVELSGPQPTAVQAEAAQTVRRVHVPVVVQVTGLALTREGVSVTLRVSHVRHVLRRESSRFDESFAALRDALGTAAFVAVTESPDDHHIIDVRPFSPAPSPPEVQLESSTPAVLAKVLKKAKKASLTAKKLYNLVAGASCDPLAPAAPCIPFLFPHDGCWARAHEMCRLLIAAGAAPRKIWISGQLSLQTTSDPACELIWNFHVAAIVGTGSKARVIDPATCAGPVTRAKWITRLNATAYTVIETDSLRYRPRVETDFGDGHNEWKTDGTFQLTDADLVTFRGLLLDQTIAKGPPPFTCPKS